MAVPGRIYDMLNATCPRGKGAIRIPHRHTSVPLSCLLQSTLVCVNVSFIYSSDPSIDIYSMILLLGMFHEAITIIINGALRASFYKTCYGSLFGATSEEKKEQRTWHPHASPTADRVSFLILRS